MCGLFGALGYRSVNTTEVYKALQGRGPDDRGRWSENNQPEGLELLHTRLAIQDCSDLGHQPMVSSDGGLVLIFNGEIYNQKSLRKELEQKGWDFRSECDTEVLLVGFQHWGQGLWRRLNGIFAIACWETNERRLTLVRDRFGIKPLVWSKESDGRCLFASELSAIMASGCIDNTKFDSLALESYQFWGAVAGPRTLLKNIHSLKAGHSAILEQSNGWRIQPYIETTVAGHQSKDWSLNHATKAIDEALNQAVERQSIGEHPVGIYLSGGLDSGLLAAILQNHQTQQINSISIGFQYLPGAIDESDRAEITAAHLDLQHHTILIGPEELDKHFDSFISAIDQPSIDGFNSFIITQGARKLGMKVAFSGLGADEIFGGYPHMLMGSIKQANYARQIRLNMLNKDKRQRLTAERLEQAGITNDNDKVNQAMCSQLELSGYLQDTLLRDADATTMAQGLELRIPYLDQDLVETAMTIPQILHQAEGSKTLLRRIAEPLLPTTILKAPKQGFNLALSKWLLHNPRFNPGRISKILRKSLADNEYQVPQRSIASSWMLLRINGRYAPYWRWIVLAEWLATQNNERSNKNRKRYWDENQ